MEVKRDWSDFVPPERIDEQHPFLGRHCQSKLLYRESVPGDQSISRTGSHSLSTIDREIYGDPSHPILFRVGNGGAGYTGILQVLAERYIATHGNDFRIGWVANHSRHTQVALLADLVQVALTYEPHNEDLAIEEGWARRVCRVFNDHFILVGNKRNAAYVKPGTPIVNALSEIGRRAMSDQKDTVFHTRRDGSATYCKEQKLLRDAQVDLLHDFWIHTYPLPPYEALVNAATESLGVYLLTDRATYLTAKRDSMIPDMWVYAEGGDELLNPCSALINTRVPHSLEQQAAIDFVNWLSGDEAQTIIRAYGQDWKHGKPLFSVATETEFAKQEGLAGLEW
ncbi:hypothetical protein LTR08_003080 [Meristemomyces frigidus]|nr:hypothetical protein LTR08_003080 [Meristemomyces frigidus]